MSEQTREPTTEFFKKHAYFGLRPENVVMFEQSTMPCMDHNGKIILETPSSIAKAPGPHLYHVVFRSMKTINELFHTKLTIITQNSLLWKVLYMSDKPEARLWWALQVESD